MTEQRSILQIFEESGPLVAEREATLVIKYSGGMRYAEIDTAADYPADRINQLMLELNELIPDLLLLHHTLAPLKRPS